MTLHDYISLMPDSEELTVWDKDYDIEVYFYGGQPDKNDKWEMAFERIKGNDKTRIEWLCTIYESYIEALGYKPIGWRETAEEKEMPRF